MGCNRCECTVLGLILSVIAGVTLGVLFSLGFVSTGVIFWAFLAIGVAAFFAAPVYSALSVRTHEDCFCKTSLAYLVATVGTVVVAAVGLVIRLVASTLLVSITVGLATFFVVLLLSTLVCLMTCLCKE